MTASCGGLSQRSEQIDTVSTVSFLEAEDASNDRTVETVCAIAHQGETVREFDAFEADEKETVGILPAISQDYIYEEKRWLRDGNFSLRSVCRLCHAWQSTPPRNRLQRRCILRDAAKIADVPGCQPCTPSQDGGACTQHPLGGLINDLAKAESLGNPPRHTRDRRTNMSRHAHKLEQEARQLIGKNWSKGKLTREKLLSEVRTIAHYCARSGLQSITHMGSKHVTGFFDELKSKNLSASTLANYATAMRTVAAAIGKKNIVQRTNAELGIVRSDRYAPKTGDTTKMMEIRNEIARKHEWMGLALDMQRAFGLRQKESLLSNQVKVVNGRQMLIVNGAKGGRERLLPIDTAQKVEALAAVNAYIKDTGGNSIIPPDKTLLQGYNSLKNAYHRAGGCKESSTNQHLSRHNYGQSERAEGKSDKEIAEHLGHSREDVVRHYC